MNPSISDPNNHAPELTPGDDWGDDEGAAKARPTPLAALPPKRISNERPSAVTEPTVEIGLRIDSNFSREETTDSPRRLEVQEIGSGVVRLEQAAASPPKVERQLKFHERPVREEAERRQQGETAAWGTAKRHPIRWILLSGVGIVGIVIFGLFALPSINAPNKDRERIVSSGSTHPSEDEIEGAAEMNWIITRQPEAVQLYHAYATASRWDEVASLMRQDQAKDESLRARWEPKGVSKKWSIPTDCAWSADKIGQRCYGLLAGELPDHSRFSAYFIRAGNNLLLDWKATTGYGTATFEELSNGGGDPAEIRGNISPADFYTASWPEADYQSYRFTAPDGIISIWCYARRNELANGLIAPRFNQGVIVKESKESLQFTLRLQRGPGDTPPNQWAIGEVRFQGWVNP